MLCVRLPRRVALPVLGAAALIVAIAPVALPASADDGAPGNSGAARSCPKDPHGVHGRCVNAAAQQQNRGPQGGQKSGTAQSAGTHHGQGSQHG